MTVSARQMQAEQPHTLLELAWYILSHQQTWLIAFTAVVLYMLYLTHEDHAMIIQNQSKIVDNEVRITAGMQTLAQNDEALIRMEDRQIQIMVQLMPRMERVPVPQISPLPQEKP